MSELYPDPDEVPITSDEVWRRALTQSTNAQRSIEQAAAEKSDPVNHPSHYTHYQGLEVIDLTEQMNFNKGNAVKYVCRAGIKNPDTEVQDLQKAIWYLNREIERIQQRP